MMEHLVPVFHATSIPIDGSSKQEDGFLSVIIRHKKNNFGRLLEPFGVEIAFGENETEVSGRELEAGELLSKRSPTVRDKILGALEVAPMFPDVISEKTDVPLPTVKNTLTDLRKEKLVEDTGKKKGQAREVRLVKDQSEEAA